MRHPRTRMGLLAARAQLALARQGQELLEQKREALLREFRRELGLAAASVDDLAAAAAAGRSALGDARAQCGEGAVAAAASAAGGTLALELGWTRVMGVAVPALDQAPLASARGARSRAIEASGPSLELARARFDTLLVLAIRHAIVEARLRSLGREIQRTSRRLNALRTRVVPALAAEAATTALLLEQREREDRFRLVRFRAARDRAQDPSEAARPGARRTAGRAGRPDPRRRTAAAAIVQPGI